MLVNVTRSNILLTSAGRRVELMQAFQDSLKERMTSSRVYCADLKPDLSSACAAADSPYSLPRVTSPDYPQALLSLCRELDIALVIPTIDTELLVMAQQKAAFAEQGVTLVVSDERLIALCRDKRLTPRLYAELGIDTLAIFDPAALTFPCFTKPAGGSSSIGAFRLDRADEIDQGMRDDPDRMYMDLASPDWGETTVDIYCDRAGEVMAIVPRQRIETRAGEVSKGCTRRGWLHAYLAARLKRIPGGVGCLTLQVFTDDVAQRCYAIEINPRFGGGYPLSYAAGADFPGWLIDEYMLGKTLEPSDSWEEDLLMLRYDAKILVHHHPSS